MDINKNKLYECMLQLTDEQQRLVWDYILKTCEANLALRRLTVHGTEEMDLSRDTGNICFSNAVTEYVEFAGGEFQIFHTVSGRFSKKDFGAATENEIKANIDAIMQKEGAVLGRYFINGENMCIVLDYSRQESDGRYIVTVYMQQEYDSQDK